MALPVVTVASGGLPVVDMTATAPKFATPVTEAANGRGIAVTQVAARGMPVVYAYIGGDVAPGSTFDPATVTDTVLSNGNLTATHTTTNANSGARVAKTLSTGKYYFEIKFVASHGNFDGAGLAPAATTYNNFALAASNQIFVARSGDITINAVFTSKNIGIFAPNDILCTAIDLGARLVWCSRNSGLWNNDGTANPATGIAGLSFPAAVSLSPMVCFVGAGTAINDAYTGNFGGSAFLRTVPGGFTSGWPA